jgi:DnaK suppressor protein
MNANQNGPSQKFSGDELDSIRNSLIEKRQSLTQSQASQLDALNSSQGHHLADLEEMGGSSDTGSLCEIMDISASTIEQIDRALEKIGADAYGVCEGCSEPIHRARLKYLPFASHCIECQRKQEQMPQADEAPLPLEELP